MINVHSQLEPEIVAETFLSELHTREGRKAVAEAITALFERWRLDSDSQASLLGMPDVDRLLGGEPLPDDPAVLERAGHLLAIDRALKRLYADDQALRDGWIRFPNPLLSGRTPLAVLRSGPDGLTKVRTLIESGRTGA